MTEFDYTDWLHGNGLQAVEKFSSAQRRQRRDAARSTRRDRQDISRIRRRRRFDRATGLIAGAAVAAAAYKAGSFTDRKVLRGGSKPVHKIGTDTPLVIRGGKHSNPLHHTVMTSGKRTAGVVPDKTVLRRRKKAK